jgi:hypothetical protein
VSEKEKDIVMSEKEKDIVKKICCKYPICVPATSKDVTKIMSELGINDRKDILLAQYNRRLKELAESYYNFK